MTLEYNIIFSRFSVVSRIISLALLCYVYHEHWLEVGGDSVRLAVLETVPYALLVVLGNVGLQVFNELFFDR